MWFIEFFEDELKNGIARCAWRGIKAMVGIQDKEKEVFNPDKFSDELLSCLRGQSDSY